MTAQIEFVATRSDLPPASELFARLNALLDEQYAHLGRALRPGSVTTTPVDDGPRTGVTLDTSHRIR